jgi:hypothetical protein
MKENGQFHTRQVISALRNAINSLPTSARLPDVPASQKALKELSAVDAAPSELKGDALEQVRQRLTRAGAGAGGVKAADPRDIRDGIWLLWSQREPLFSLSGLFDAIVEQASRRPSVRRNLVEAWIRSFSARKPEIEEAGHFIRRLISNPDDIRLAHWGKLDQRFRLFDARGGPEAIARYILSASEPVDAILDETGFADPLRSVSGYMLAVQAKMMDMVSQALRQNAGRRLLERILTFVTPRGSWRFKETRGEVARALLSPWLTNGPVPDLTIRDEVRSFLLSHFGDPRIRGGDWQEVGPAGITLMLKWLAGVSLKSFFELIADHALDEHFKYRRAFWSSYLDAGVIDEAWLALGRNVYHKARTIPELRGAFGRLEGQGVSGNQSIIILRVGGLVFCEWSHSGRIRAWKADSSNAPRPGKQTNFARDDVTKPCLLFPRNRFGRGGSRDDQGLTHFNSKDFYWQQTVANLIHHNNGPLLENRSWKPR